MPAFPEACGVGGLVGRVKVFGQIEAHEHGHADGDVGIAREVGIDLERVDEQGGEVLEGGVEQRIFEDTVNEGDGEVVGEDKFFEEAVHDPEDGDAELAAREEEGLVELGDELVGTDDGACHELGEEGGVEAKVEDVVGVLHFAFIDIDDVADVLKGEEADAYGEEDGVSDGIMGGSNGVEDVGEEVGILEVAEHAEVDDHAEDHEPEAVALGGGAFLGEMVEAHAEEVAHHGGEGEEHHIFA